MAAYRRVDDLMVTCGLTACTPGSAPGPTLGIEYGKPLPLIFYTDDNLSVAQTNGVEAPEQTNANTDVNIAHVTSIFLDAPTD